MAVVQSPFSPMSDRKDDEHLALQLQSLVKLASDSLFDCMPLQPGHNTSFYMGIKSLNIVVVIVLVS